MQLPKHYSIDNFLSMIASNAGGEFDFLFSQSGATNVKSHSPLTFKPIPEIGKIKMWHLPNNSKAYSDGQLEGLQLYDRDGNLVYESAKKYVYLLDKRFRSIETVLDPDERIVGIKSHILHSYVVQHFSF